MHLPDGRATRVPVLPLSLDGERPAVRMDPPSLGAHTRALLEEVGYTQAEIEQLLAANVIKAGDAARQAPD